MKSMIDTIGERVASTQDHAVFGHATYDPFVQHALGVASMPKELFGAVRSASADTLSSTEHFLNFGALVTDLAQPEYLSGEDTVAVEAAINWAESDERYGDQSRLYEVAARVEEFTHDYAVEQSSVLADITSFYLEHFNGGSLGHGVESIDPAITAAVYRAGVFRRTSRFVHSHLLDRRVRYNQHFTATPEHDMYEAAKANGDQSLVSRSPYGGDQQQRAAMFALGGVYSDGVPRDIDLRLKVKRDRNVRYATRCT